MLLSRETIPKPLSFILPPGVLLYRVIGLAIAKDSSWIYTFFRAFFLLFHLSLSFLLLLFRPWSYWIIRVCIGGVCVLWARGFPFRKQSITVAVDWSPATPGNTKGVSICTRDVPVCFINVFMHINPSFRVLSEAVWQQSICAPKVCIISTSHKRYDFLQTRREKTPRWNNNSR